MSKIRFAEIMNKLDEASVKYNLKQIDDYTLSIMLNTVNTIFINVVGDKIYFNQILIDLDMLDRLVELNGK